ncbi:hypothetical protein FRC11_001924 [Ceratobasidium sp. 423]|nr:hypothetical protein FRC11_001924 [Ceratobasidium sp. 423]
MSSMVVSSDNNSLSLNCCVLADVRRRTFRVRVSPTMAISELVPEIVRVYEQSVPRSTLLDITPFKIDVPRRELENIETPPEDSELEGMDDVGDYWPDPEQINRRHIHILVSAEIAPVIQTQSQQAGVSSPSTTSPSPPEAIHSTGQENTARAFRDAPSASIAAQHSAFEKQQAKDNTPIYNGRPYERTAIPIQLFHPVFNLFTTELEQTGELSAIKYRAVEKFLFGSQAIYSTEPVRWSAIKGLLTAAIGYPIHKDEISKCQSDGVITFTEEYSAAKAYGVIVELKNEIGTDHSDPWIQGAQSFARYWSQLESTELREATRCPTLIISIAGPWMCISGAVYLDRVVIQPLTDYIWLGRHPQQDHHLVRVTRLFDAIKTSISSLKEYYSTFIKPGSSLPEDLYRFFPYIQSVQGSNGMINFKYKDTLGGPGVVRPVFEATTEDGRAIVVKFAQFYNFEAHQLLAAQSLAPKLLSLRAEPVGGLVMIVMEFCGTSLDYYFDSTGPGLEPDAQGQVQRDVKKALDLLHANNLVFGDLRPPNVLVVPASKGTFHGQLVDFEWCGIEGKARYPVGMNESKRIRWPAGVEKGSLLSQEHDIDMFEKLFSPPAVEELKT